MTTFNNTYLHDVGLVFILGVTLFSITRACQTCNSPWKKVYETDVDGSIIWGNEADIVMAAASGARIKRFIHDWHNVTRVEELDFYFQSGLGGICGDTVMHVTKDRWDHFMDDGRMRLSATCSHSSLHGDLELTLGEYNVTNKKVRKAHVTWFVKLSTCVEPVYSHFPDGTAVRGNKDQLKFAVVSGYDIKFLSQTVFHIMFKSDNTVVLEDSEEVVGQAVWSTYPLSSGFSGEWLLSMASSNGLWDLLVWHMGEDNSFAHFNFTEKTAWFIESCWRHSFTHDEHGVEQDGSLVDLIAAVEQGRRVKVVMGGYSTEVDNIQTHGGQVSAQLLSQLSKNDSYTFLDDMIYIWQMVHTSGTVRTRRYSYVNAINRGDTVEKKTISWFVDTCPWTKVLSTEKYGQVTFGSKADLKNAIENGASVRIGLQNSQGSGWFVIKAESLEVGPSEEFAAELYRSVSTEAVSPTEFQIKDDPFWRFMVVTTQSNVDILQWRVGARINDGHFSEKATVNWFVNY